MAAHVVEGAHDSIVAADHEHRRRTDRERQEVTGIRNLESEAGEEPALMPDLRQLGRIECVGQVEGTRHAVAVAA